MFSLFMFLYQLKLVHDVRDTFNKHIMHYTGETKKCFRRKWKHGGGTNLTTATGSDK